MPTFASIDFDPVVRSRLVVVAPSSVASALAHKDENNKKTTAASTRPLESPHSLLLHPPEEWRLKHSTDNDDDNNNNNSKIAMSTVAPHEALALRRQVAASLHLATTCGKRQRHIVGVVTGGQIVVKDPSNQETNNENSFSPHSRGHSKARRIDGFLSVADTLQWQNNLQRQPFLSSGVPAWDALFSDTTTSTTTTTMLPIYANNSSSGSSTDLMNIHGGLPWGTVVQLSGGPGTGKTQFALQWTAAAAAAQEATIHYLVPAYASCTALARRLAQIMGSSSSSSGESSFGAHMSNVCFHSFRDDCELLLILAHLEQEWNGESIASCATIKDEPWLLVVDGWSPLTSQLKPWRWQRLVRLYHGIVLVVTSSSLSSSSTSSWGTMHLHLDEIGRMICHKHPEQDKVGSFLPRFSFSPCHEGDGTTHV